MLQRVENVRLMFSPSIFTSQGRVNIYVGRKSYHLVNKVHKSQWARDRAQQAGYPVLVLSTPDRNLWQFQERFYWDNDALRADQIHAILVTRQQREQQRIGRAQAMVAMGTEPRITSRHAIPDDVKQLVFMRDNGRCRHCGSTVEIQFDHVIPLAMGGSSTAENLQILCAACNRKKGAGLTVASSVAIQPPPRLAQPVNNAPMQNEPTDILTRVLAGIADLQQTRERLEVHLDNGRQSITRLDRQATDAMSVDREDLAYEALRRKAAVQEQLSILQIQYGQLLEQEEKLKAASVQLSTRQ